MDLTPFNDNETLELKIKCSHSMFIEKNHLFTDNYIN